MTPMLQDTPGGRNAGHRPWSGPAPLPDDATPALLVPTEEVLLLAVDLPLPSHRRRLEALPFALEERIAAPVETVHLALGREVGERRYLVGVAAHAAMARWLDQAAAAGTPDAALVPDALALPVTGGGWTVATEAGRVLARRADGTGFALPAAQFGPVWEAAGRPPLAGVAPAGLEAAPLALAPLDERLVPPPLDLRQGLYARAVVASPLRRLAAVAAIGVAAHALIAAADTLALGRIADRWRGETAAEVARLRPGTQIDADDLAATAADLVPAGASAPPGRLLPLVLRASAALGPGTTLRRVAFDGRRLTLDVAAPDEAALAAVAARLQAAGLAPLRRALPADGTGMAARLILRGAA